MLATMLHRMVVEGGQPWRVHEEVKEIKERIILYPYDFIARREQTFCIF